MQSIEMRKTLSLSILALLVLVTQQCPLDINALPPELNCISNIACASNSTEQVVLAQNCNTKWYFKTTSSPLKQLTSIPNLGTDLEKFIYNGASAQNIKITDKYGLVNYNNQTLYYYPFGTLTYKFKYISPCLFTDYSSETLPNGNIKVLLICNQKIITRVFTPAFHELSNTTVPLNQNMTQMIPLNNSSLKAVGTQQGHLFLFDSNLQKFIANYSNPLINSSVSILKSEQLGKNQHKLYVGVEDGTIAELRVTNKKIRLRRMSELFKGQEIHQIGHFKHSPYLIITDKRGNVSQIDITTGILLDSINVEPYLSVKSDIGMSLLLNNETSYYLFNTANSVIFFAAITPDNTKNQIVLSCFNLQFYNNTLQDCQPCSSTCATCHQLTGSCSDCVEQHFNSNGQCLSCFYDSRGLTHHFGECFSSSQQAVMETSEAVVELLATSVSNFAAFLNLFGLLFLFLKLVNNWNIISLYFFVEIEQPFFLDNVLSMLFENFSSSVLKTIGIEFQPSFGTVNRAKGKKFELSGVTTDFLYMNSEQIIFFIYSVILITTVYKILNFLLAKINIMVFEQNTAIAIIEQFVGSFTITLLPFYYILFQPYRNKWEKINSAVFLLFVGIALVVPFFFLIFDYQYKVVRTNKVQNNDQNHIAQSVNLGLTKRIQAWREDDSRERFFYGILSFSTALMACNPNVPIFIYGVGFVHLLCLGNTLLCRKIKKNILLQKIFFLIYHSLFSTLYYIDSEGTKFKISLILVLLIILITVHQLILSFFLKVYFVYMLVKGKWEKEEKIKMFFEKNQEKMKHKNRVHPVPLPPLPEKKEEKVEIKFQCNNLQVKIVKDKEHGNKAIKFEKSKSKKRKAKSAKKIEENPSSSSRNQSESCHSLEKSKGLKTERRK